MPYGPESGGRTCKVAEIGNFIFCTCMEYFSTGLPCVHQFHVGLKRNLTLVFSERWAKTYERAALEKPAGVVKILGQHLREQQFVYDSLLRCGSQQSAGLHISAENINIRSPVLLSEHSKAEGKASVQLQEHEELLEVGAPVHIGKSFLIADKIRTFKNTDNGNLPWSSGNGTSSAIFSTATKRINNQEEQIEFFENAAKPPSKRERQPIPGVKNHNLKQTAKNVLSGA